MKLLLSVIALVYFMSLIDLTKQEVFQTSCASYNVQPITGFKKRDYDGLWYVYRLNEYEEIINQDCMKWNYLPIKSKRSHVIETSKNLATKEQKTIHSEMYFDEGGVGQFTYNVPLDNEQPEYVKIVSTDRETYSVEWSCIDDLAAEQCECFVYVMTRKPIPDQVTIDTCEDILKKHKIDISRTRLVVQDEDKCK